MIDHVRKHVIPQLDGHNENEDGKQEHDELCCFKCEEMTPDCQGWEFQFSNRPAKNHTRINNTILPLYINKHGDLSYYLS